MKFRRDGVGYLETLARLDGECVPLARLGDERDGRAFSVRHDVDHDIDKALRMAQLENDNGISSTYYIRSSAPYWVEDERLGERVVCLHEMGHEVGLHHSAVSLYVGTGVQPQTSLSLDLQWLRLRVPVVSACSHGDKTAREGGFTNYHVWTEYEDHLTKPNACPAGCERVSLADFGLDFEAYFLTWDAYISDSGGRWRAPPERNDGKLSTLSDGIDRFNNMDTGRLCLLAHPCWWE